MPVKKKVGVTPTAPKPAKSSEVTEVKSASSVYMEKSVTRNLGDYNSAKVTVGVTVPVNPTKEDLKAVETTISLVDTLLDEEIERQLQSLEKEHR